MDLLERDAFGNFRQLLEDVTLSPAMGHYLNMLGNDKEEPATGGTPTRTTPGRSCSSSRSASRDVHPDGTLQLDANGLPIPTYDQDVVMGFAHVFTGWSFGGNEPADPGRSSTPDENYRLPMVVWPSHHSDRRQAPPRRRRAANRADAAART